MLLWLCRAIINVNRFSSFAVAAITIEFAATFLFGYG
jgi:hypothetical protein